MQLYKAKSSRLAIVLSTVVMALASGSCIKKKAKKVDDGPSNNASNSTPCDQATDPLCNSKLQSTQQNKNALVPFESEAAYKDYLAAIVKANQGINGEGSSGDGSPGSFGNGIQAASAPGESNIGITNTQETGVDEGGIVKNIGDHLIVLRKGRLYAVNIKTPGAPRQTDAINVAPVKNLHEHVWYDEMLVLEKHIIVLGFRYFVPAAAGAIPGSSTTPLTSGSTEIHTFALEDGAISRGKSLFIESTDYFSATNFSTRLIGKTLFFYLPEQALRHATGTPEATIPRYLSYNESPAGGAFSFGPSVLTYTDIHRPIDLPVNPTIHMLVACKLDTPLEPKCSARGVLGDVSQHFYVSKDHAYLWSYPWVYSLSLDSLTPKVFRVKGSGEPISYLGFKQTDFALTVIVKDIRNAKGSIIDEELPNGNATPPGDNTAPDEPTTEGPDTSPARVEQVLNALTLPLVSFDGIGSQNLSEANVTRLYSTGGIIQTSAPRVVGRSFVIPFATLETEPVSPTSAPSKNDGQNFLATFDIDSRAFKISEWSGTITRVESLGENTALIVDHDHSASAQAAPSITRSLRLSTIKAGERGMDSTPISQISLKGASEGESRSHAFFYKNDASGGMLGLAVVNGGSDQATWFGAGVSNLAFVSKDADHKLTLSGVVSSQGTHAQTCETSCVDWYGNTRPIFMGSRLFALMGYELGEVTLQNGAITRLNAPINMK